MPLTRFFKLWTAITLSVLGFTSAQPLAADSGPLDRPLFSSSTRPGVSGAVLSANQAVAQSGGRVSNPQALVNELRREVAQEQKELEKLSRKDLEKKAESGERAAQVVLGADFAQEAALLSFAPAAANDALSDAARWYSLAASRGFPGAPSLDTAGVRFYPIRVHRALRR